MEVTAEEGTFFEYSSQDISHEEVIPAHDENTFPPPPIPATANVIVSMTPPDIPPANAETETLYFVMPPTAPDRQAVLVSSITIADAQLELPPSDEPAEPQYTALEPVAMTTLPSGVQGRAAAATVSKAPPYSSVAATTVSENQDSPRAPNSMQELDENQDPILSSTPVKSRLPSKLNSRNPLPAKKSLYICPVPACKYSTTVKPNLVRHQNTHQTNRQTFICEHCSKIYADKYQLKEHISVIHDKEKCFICEICGHMSQSRQGLHNHILIKHKQAKHVCRVCNKPFINTQHLMAHMSTHTETPMYECKKCHRKYYHKSSLTEHNKSCSGIKPYKCHTCDVSFAGRAGLKDHEQTKHQGVTFVCKCGKAYSWRPSLNRHKKNCFAFDDSNVGKR